MPVKITNVSQHHAHAMKRRTAPRLQMEPVIAGDRLRLRQTRVLTDEQYEINKDWLAENERGGVITVEHIQTGKPTKDIRLPQQMPVTPPEFVPEAPPLEEPPATSSLPETPSSSAVTQPLPGMGQKKQQHDNKKPGK